MRLDQCAFRSLTIESRLQAGLGRCWGKQFPPGQAATISMINIAFPETVTSLRNAGVTGSSPVGGTSPSTGNSRATYATYGNLGSALG